ncbi:hypothetical protein S40293_08675 [Stachybotrys chartarum IBT 40293]|nr:hypothetical protein S40293_08675 [Stachybotrys chartarum IBT 40293]
MPGTLIPPWFQRNEPNVDTLATASIIFGVSIGLAAAATIRTCRQTRKTWRRTHKVTTYVVLIWLELISSTIIAGVTWGYLRHHIEPSLWFYTGLILLWIFQTQCILQIIINRIALITVNKARIRRLKWAVFIVVLLINIAVACIWIPSRLQISTTYHDINEGWDRTEKALLAIIDVGLNLYFIYLVRSSLISLGLKRYVPLYRFNIAMIIISVAMDGLLIGMMSLPNTFL